MSMTVTNPAFSSKDPSETVILGFDFSALTSSPSSPVVSIARASGTADPSPAAMLSGSPSVSSGKAIQRVVGGLIGANYVLRCQVDAPDGSRYILSGVLPVRAA